MLQAMTILDVDNDWVKLEKLLAWQLTKVKSKKEGHSVSTERAKQSLFATLMGHLSLQKCGVRTEVSKL